MATNTQPPNDKSKFLRGVLSEPTKAGDVIPILREMAHILIQVNAELSTLAAVRAEISQLNKFVLDFIEDNLRFRMAREKRESEMYTGSQIGLTTTQKKLQKIAIQKQRVAARDNSESEKAPFTWGGWFLDRVLPGLTQTVIVIVVGFVFAAVVFYVVEQIRAALGP